jgi:hypothetical protein
VSSDVFEHVAPPVQRAFVGAYALLRPGGLLVLTVPYVPDGSTQEHYPELDDYALVPLQSGHVLVNRTSAGALQVFEDLVFHGGPGATLEMRLFALPDIVASLEAAGFEEVSVVDEDLAHGVVWQDDYSRTLTARKPRQRRHWPWRRSGSW